MGSSKVSAKQLICLLLPLETTEFLCSGTESLDQRAAIAVHSFFIYVITLFIIEKIGDCF